MFLDYATIIGRAAWCRDRAGFMDETPPYSTRQLLERVFPKIAVAGADLPRGVTEMAVAEEGRRALFYSRKVPHTSQRVGLMHGLYHHLSDIKSEIGLRECNLVMAKYEQATHRTDPVEASCDLFAAEILIPLDVLDSYVHWNVYAKRSDTDERAISDEIDTLSSRFNVPRGFMRWRLHDLHYLRRSHFRIP